MSLRKLRRKAPELQYLQLYFSYGFNEVQPAIGHPAHQELTQPGPAPMSNCGQFVVDYPLTELVNIPEPFGGHSLSPLFDGGGPSSSANCWSIS